MDSLSCECCPLAHCTPVADRGPATAPVVVVGQCPGAEENTLGKAFVGPSGKILVQALAAAGLDPGNILYTNSVRCWDGDTPKAKLIDQCRTHLTQTISQHPRQLIITLGNEACYTLLGGKVGGVTKRHGQIVDSAEFGCPVFVSLHPAYILRNLPAYDHWVQQFRRAAALLAGNLHPLDDFELEYTVPSAAGGSRSVFNLDDNHWALAADELAVDIETTGLNYWQDELLGIGLSTGTQALYITIRHKPEALGNSMLAGMGDMVLSPAEYEHLRAWLAKVIGPGHRAKLILHNGKFDARFIHYRLGLDIRPVEFDTMLAHHLCDENAPHSLKQCVQTWLMIQSWEDQAQGAMAAGALSSLPIADMARYCATDCVATYRLAGELRQRLAADACDSLYYNLVQPLSDLLLGVELRGLYVDRALLDELDARCSTLLAELETQLREIPGWGDGHRCPWRKDQALEGGTLWEYCDGPADMDVPPTVVVDEEEEEDLRVSWWDLEKIKPLIKHTFWVRECGKRKWLKYDDIHRSLGLNPRSDVDLRQVMFGGHPWTLPYTVVTEKTGEPSCAAEALSGLLERRIPAKAADFIRTLLHYNKLNKLHGTFVRGLIPEVAPDGAVHASFMFNSFTEDSPRTGRLSSSHPNLQNQPKPLRPLFVARDGYTFWEADQSQLEVRVWAGLSKDPKLLEIFNRSLVDPEFDFHREMAAIYWSVPPDQVTPEQRQRGKAVTFGAGMYGGGPGVVMRQAGVSEDEARALIEGMHKGFPTGQRWLRGMVLHAKQHGYVVSPIGRRRRLPDINAADDRVRAEAERQSQNSCIQGLASDINNMSALRINHFIQQSGADAHIVNLVHDSILIEVAKDQVEQLGPIFKQIMEQEPYAGFGVPLQVEAEVYDHWAGELDMEKILMTGRMKDE